MRCAQRLGVARRMPPTVASAAASARAEAGARASSSSSTPQRYAAWNESCERSSVRRSASSRARANRLFARRGEERAAEPAAEGRVRRVRGRERERVERCAERRVGGERAPRRPADVGRLRQLCRQPLDLVQRGAPPSARRRRRGPAARPRAVARPCERRAQLVGRVGEPRGAARAGRRRRRERLDRRAARRQLREQRRPRRIGLLEIRDDACRSAAVTRARQRRFELGAIDEAVAVEPRAIAAAPARGTRDSRLVRGGALGGRIDLPPVQQLPRAGSPLRRAGVADEVTALGGLRDDAAPQRQRLIRRQRRAASPACSSQSSSSHAAYDFSGGVSHAGAPAATAAAARCISHCCAASALATTIVVERSLCALACSAIRPFRDAAVDRRSARGRARCVGTLRRAELPRAAS